MRTSSRWTTLALVALLPLAACGGEDEDMDDMEGEGMEEAAPAPAPAQPDMMEPMTVMLEAKNESGVTGEVTATHHADSVTVEASISGASSDGSYPAHIHMGDCTAPGEVLAPLTSLEVTGGAGSSTTTLAASQVPESQGAVIQIHDPSGSPIACGDLRGHGETGGEMGGGEMGDTAGGGGM